jgi:hypothetical protein
MGAAIGISLVYGEARRDFCMRFNQPQSYEKYQYKLMAAGGRKYILETTAHHPNVFIDFRNSCENDKNGCYLESSIGKLKLGTDAVYVSEPTHPSAFGIRDADLVGISGAIVLYRIDGLEQNESKVFTFGEPKYPNEQLKAEVESCLFGARAR